MHERLISEAEVLGVLHTPDSCEPDSSRGGRLATRYLPEWDRILVVAFEEHRESAVVTVKTVLWSKAN